MRGTNRSGRVAALAVDVEPTVFWDGEPSDFPHRLATWKRQVVFVEGDAPGHHGHVADQPPSTNGSSGYKVAHQYRQPLGLH